MALMWNLKKLLLVTGKTTVVDSSSCVLKGFFGVLEIGIYVRVLVKNFVDCKTGIYGHEINAHCFKIS